MEFITLGSDKKIADNEGLTNILLSMVEECGELSQMSTKLLRVNGLGIYTPADKVDVVEHFKEELSDVYSNIRMLCYLLNIQKEELETISLSKQKRYFEREKEK